MSMAATRSTLAMVLMALLTTMCLVPVVGGHTPVSCMAQDGFKDPGVTCPTSLSTYLTIQFGDYQTNDLDQSWYRYVEVDCDDGGYCEERAKNVYRCCDKFTFTLLSPSSMVLTYENITVGNLLIKTLSSGFDPDPHCITNAPVPSHFQFTAPETTPFFNYMVLCYDLCSTPGSVCGDPKLVGGDGVVFYFHGRKDQDFCLVSDSDLHINAHFIGKRPAGRTRDFTWVQALGFVYGSHTLTIGVKRVAEWDNTVDHLEFSYNGQALALSPKSSWTSPGAAMTLIRGGAANAVDLEIKEKMGVSLNAVPIGKHESDVHHYGITGEDCFAHFDMQFRFHNLSTSVNGVLGQTYQPGFVNPVKRDVAMPVMGGAERFESSSLVGTDCAVSQYTATAVARGSVMPSFEASCGSSGLPNGVPGGITCRSNRRSLRR